MRSPLRQNKIPRIPILMYHEVSDHSEPSKKKRHTNPAYCISANQFREQMEYIHNNSYKSLTLNELLDIRNDAHKKSVILTFDDGWNNTYTNAFPILKELGLTATVFVITDLVASPNYLSWQNLVEMTERGISIQSHTVTHQPLAELKANEIKYELEQSKKIIENHLGTLVDIISAPHGMINQTVIDILRSVGYKALCTSEPGFSHSDGDPAILNRINISSNYDILTFAKILEADQFTIFPAAISKKTKNLIRKVLGYHNYRRLYQLSYRIRTQKPS
jgi:peptidoglycan/xylan/chitin deacetylase (PgdA/CDA1 family)